MSKNTKVNTAYFKEILDNVDISLRGLARKWGVDPAGVSRLFSGKREMRMSEASKLSALTGRPIAEILENAGMSLMTQAPIVGYVDGDGNARIDWAAKERSTVRPVDTTEKLVAIELRTVGSKFEAVDGWLAYVVAPKGVEGGILGKPCIIKLKGKGGPLLRTVRRGYQAGRYTLVAPDQSVVNDAELEYATPIAWLRTHPA